MSIKTEEELAQAIKNNESTIVIEGDLKNKVLKIKATGNTAWGVVIGIIAIAVTAIMITGGAATPASAVVGIGAVSILGASATTSAVAIAVAAGGVAVLNKLRDYKIIEDSDKLVLQKS